MRDRRGSNPLECIMEKKYDNKENILEGKNPIFEAYKSGRGIRKLFVLKGNRDEKINKLVDDLKKTHCIISFLDRDKLDAIASTKANQGIIAEVEDYKYVEVDDILSYAESKGEDPFILILDEIMDPHNFGAIIRTVEALGVHGIIVKNRNQSVVSSIVSSASAGAVNYVKIARVSNLSKTIEELKEKGFWFACADMDGEPIGSQNLKGKFGLVVGNEGSGVSRLVKEKCDFIVSIPMKGKIDSLNVSVATGILLYDILKFRQA